MMSLGNQVGDVAGQLLHLRRRFQSWKSVETRVIDGQISLDRVRAESKPAAKFLDDSRGEPPFAAQKLRKRGVMDAEKLGECTQGVMRIPRAPTG